MENQPIGLPHHMLAYERDATGRDHQHRGALNAAVSSFSEALSCHPSPDRHFRLGLASMENERRTPIGHRLVPLGRGNGRGRRRRVASRRVAQNGNRKAFFVAAEGNFDEAIRLRDAALLGRDGSGSSDDDA
mmetsp:Transcript_7264/g.13197  ORF Transcript_7264/g.13197 Transcript_7264/m.13197 type:complete len:132 (+) Transcript_7264:148-543(+)